MKLLFADQAKKFVQSTRIPKPAKRAKAKSLTGAAVPAVPIELQDRTAQALVVGSGLVLSEEGVGARAKQDIVDCTLFAQFHASNVVGDPSRVLEWYGAYFSALNRLGWSMTSQEFREHKESGKTVQVHKSILKVLSVVLGPGAVTALATAQAVLSGLEEVGSDSGWLTLFNQHTISAKVAKFQVVSAQPAEGGLINLAILGFELKARSKLTQILFFKHKKTSVTLRFAGGAASINEAILSVVRDDLRTKLEEIAKSFVDSVPIPGH